MKAHYIDKKRFRLLIAVYIVLALPAVLLDSLFPSLIPAPLTEAQQALDAAGGSDSLSSLAALATLFVALLGGLITALVGLLRLRPWGRTVAVVFTIASLGMQPFSGANLESSWTSTLMSLTSILWGAILTAAYYSDVAHEFDRRDA